MSLIKKHEMTERKVAANRQNQKLCHIPLTDESRERMRAAHLRHGFYSQAEEVAMRALGEDPNQFQDMLEELWQEFAPVGGLQEGLVIRQARAMWLINRADRMQEGYAVRQAEEVNSGRQDRLHARMMRLKITADSLRRLVESVAREHYVTTPPDLEKMKSLHQEGVLKEMGEIALALFYQLQPPSVGADGVDREELSRRALARIKDIFGLSGDTPPQPRFAPGFGPPQGGQQGIRGAVAPDFSPARADLKVGATAGATEAPAGVMAAAMKAPADPSPSSGQTPLVGATGPEENEKRYPRITAVEWEARERPRQLLENILTRYVEICEEQRKTILKESVKGPSPYERAAEIAPTHPNARLMRRMQDSNFRELRRVTSLMLKIKRHARRMEAFEFDSAFQDSAETKGVSGEQRKSRKILSYRKKGS